MKYLLVITILFVNLFALDKTIDEDIKRLQQGHKDSEKVLTKSIEKSLSSTGNKSNLLNFKTTSKKIKSTKIKAPKINVIKSKKEIKQIEKATEKNALKMTNTNKKIKSTQKTHGNNFSATTIDNINKDDLKSFATSQKNIKKKKDIDNFVVPKKNIKKKKAIDNFASSKRTPKKKKAIDNFTTAPKTTKDSGVLNKSAINRNQAPSKGNIDSDISSFTKHKTIKSKTKSDSMDIDTPY